MTDSDYSGSSSESEDGFENCCSGGQCSRGGRGKSSNNSMLPFNHGKIQEIILDLCDRFDFKVIWDSPRVKKAVMITTGLAAAGSLIGRHFIGGNYGAAIGGCVGGVCGVGIAAYTMRDIWDDVKYRLSDLFDIVYDYLASLDVFNYETAAALLINNTELSSQLGNVLFSTAASLLNKKITSSLGALSS